VRRGVDAARSARNHLDARPGEHVAELVRQRQSRLPDLARADDGDPADLWRQVPAHVEQSRRIRDPPQLLRILRVVEQQHAGARIASRLQYQDTQLAEIWSLREILPRFRIELELLAGLEDAAGAFFQGSLERLEPSGDSRQRRGANPRDRRQRTGGQYVGTRTPCGVGHPLAPVRQATARRRRTRNRASRPGLRRAARGCS